MLGRIFVVCSFLVSFSFFSQEELNPLLYSHTKKVKTPKTRSTCSFDSTFIYTPDTLSLPFFDDFSKNHFQKYSYNFADPSLTFDKKYNLLDLSNNPLPLNSKYTSQQTYRKTVNMSDLTESDQIFSTTDIKVADFCTYPPSYTQIKVYPPFIIYDTVDFPNPVDTVWLDNIEYFQDSAVQFFAHVQDQNSFWIDNQAEHNYTNAVNPWTLGVVTFDGTDESGIPYLFGSITVDFNDYLTSKPINLGGLTPNDSVYFSFMYQPQGFNDEPEAGDSLILEFYDPSASQWFEMWSVGGSPLQDFKKVHLKVIDPKFFKNAFQFRFKNYSSVAGALDQFHVDYVRLQKASGYQDTLFKDFSIIYPLNTILNDFTQIPWEHFKNSPTGNTSKNLEINLRNSSNVDENYLNGKILIDNLGVNDGTITILGSDLANGDINYLSNKIYQSFHDISSFYDFNTGLIGNYQEFDVTLTASAQFSNFAANDTTTFKQRFYDVYAYDDGSAEAAYGPTKSQARLAYKFTPLENDSLVGVKMRFVPSVNDVSNDLFLLTVWDDMNGAPGNVIYEDDFLNPHQPTYTYDDSLDFTNYYFNNYLRVPVSGTFYVGWRQLDQRSLNIGFDKNTNHSDKIFYSVNNGVTWANTQFTGSLLMRPIFSTALNYKVETAEIEREIHTFTIYPNPFSSTFKIQGEHSNYRGIEISDINGKSVYLSGENEREFNLEFLQNGMYLVKDIYSGKTIKIIKN